MPDKTPEGQIGFDLSPTAIILSAVGNGIASGLKAEAFLLAISDKTDPWEIDAAISAAIDLQVLMDKARHAP